MSHNVRVDRAARPHPTFEEPLQVTKHRDSPGLRSHGAFVLFAGCKPDSQGICKSEVDYTVYKPDGTVFVERKSLPLWDLQAPPAPIIQLGKAILAFQLGPDDADGEYRVKAKSDLNANITLELETRFRLK
jgi:hypothetical protein